MDAILERLDTRVFPVAKDGLKASIRSMIAPQMPNMDTMTPLQRAMLEEAVVRRYDWSSIKVQEPVGVNAALIIGENMVQSSLQSHHHAGLERGAKGFTRILEITNMKNKSDVVKIITTPHTVRIEDVEYYIPRTKKEINRLANSLVSVLLESMVESYKIMSLKDGDTYPEWYEVFASIAAKPMLLLKPQWLRVYLNPYMLYKYHVTVPMIASILEDGMNPGNTIFYAPTGVGLYFDIHMGVDAIYDMYLKIAEIMSLQVSGIKSVSSAVLFPENMLTNLQVKDLGLIEGLQTYEVISGVPAFVPAFMWERMLKAMVPDAIFTSNTGRRFISTMGFDDVTRMITKVPLVYADILDARRTIDGGQIHLIFKQIQDEYPYLEHADLRDRIMPTEDAANAFLQSLILDYHFFWYIEAVCSNVQDLYVLPEVDASRTYTTSPLDCMASLGYVAMRNMVYEGFRENIRIDPVHIKLIVNNMTLYRDPVSLKRQAIVNDKSEWMASTTFEEVNQYMRSAAFVGEEDHMLSISSHVLTGEMIPIGRGGERLLEENKFVMAKKKHGSKEDHRRKQGSDDGRRRPTTKRPRRTPTPGSSIPKGSERGATAATPGTAGQP